MLTQVMCSRKRDGQPARLLDINPGHHGHVLKARLHDWHTKFRLNVKTLAMDGLTGHKTAVKEVLTSALAVIDSCHEVQLGGEKIA